jgi:hypothetical protein
MTQRWIYVRYISGALYMRTRDVSEAIGAAAYLMLQGNAFEVSFGDEEG